MAARKLQQMHIRQPDEKKDVLGGEIYAAGGQLYQTYCAACHQTNGMGDGQRFPPLGPRSWVPGNKQRLISVVLFGLSGEIQVDGKGYNDVMPANGFLNDEQVSQILTYIRQNFGNLEQGVSVAEVADRRARGPWTPPAGAGPGSGTPVVGTPAPPR
jgi:mono/diheme cytochrome c family protein